MKINYIKHEMYESSKLLGDSNAVEKRKVGKRIVRRVVGNGMPRILWGGIIGEYTPVAQHPESINA